MIRARAELLVTLLHELYADESVPPEFRRSIEEVQGLALAALAVADPDEFSRRVPPKLRVVV